MNPEPLTNEQQTEFLRPLDLRPLDKIVTELCLLAADMQQEHPDLPTIQRSTRVNGKLVCAIVCVVDELDAYVPASLPPPESKDRV